MFEKTENPIAAQIQRVELRDTHQGEKGPITTVRVRVDIPLDADDLGGRMEAEEAAAVCALSKLATSEREDDQPHTYKIAVKRSFGRAEYVFNLRKKQVVLVADVKNRPFIKIVGDELSLSLTLEGGLGAESVAALASMVNQNVLRLQVNALQVPLALTEAA